jgi:hypothetical protein
MISGISNATPAQPVAARSRETASQKPVQSKAPAGDSAQLSQAAQARVAALQEVRETAQQTGQEANHGDLQAQRLLAREAAAKPSAK